MRHARVSLLLLTLPLSLSLSRCSSVPAVAIDDAGADDASVDASEASTDAAPPVDTGPDVDASPPPSIGLRATSGWPIFDASGGGYRYGPSIVIDTDKSIHMWTCSPGSGGAWDYIRYRHSTDGGHSWTPDVVALQPTVGGKDAFSTCDPGAVKVGAYWYVGYTSTQNAKGTQNELYIARATSPSGPFDKWNGAGWGGNPEPFVTYPGDPTYYGVGEPSMVLIGKRLYVYYTNIDGPAAHTDLALVNDATVDDWPKSVVAVPHVLDRRPGEDSTDVKFVDAYGKFIGVSTFERFSPNAEVVVYQSLDGRNFEPAPYKGARVQSGAHNVGISGDPSGHFDVAAQSFVAYAYAPAGSTWGNWPSYLDPVTLVTFPWGTTTAGQVSSIVGGMSGDWKWSGPLAWDGDDATVYSSDSHGATATATESATVDLGRTYPITALDLTPRASGYGFPVDFSVQTSTDGATFTDVPGQSYTGYATPMASPVTLTFASTAYGRYVRVNATKLGQDDQGNHYLQLAEIVPKVP